MESKELVRIEREMEPDETYLFQSDTTVYRPLDSVEDVADRLRVARGQRGMASFEVELFLGLL